MHLIDQRLHLVVPDGLLLPMAQIAKAKMRVANEQGPELLKRPPKVPVPRESHAKDSVASASKRQ
jgi:hypothetical protein